MTIDPAIAGLTLAVLVHFGGTIWWASRLAARVEHMERWQAEHDGLRERMARLEQAMLDIARSLQRIEARLTAGGE